jgi:hypothetical protein
MGVLAAKFGAIGAKGEAGEEFILNQLTKSYQVSDYRQDMIQQSQGIDFGIKHPSWRREYTLDSKNNLYICPEYYAFKIELEANGKAGWFFTSKADRIYHTNAYMGKYLYYDLNELRYFVTKRLVDNDHSQFKVVYHNQDVLLQFTVNGAHTLPISQVF